MSSVSAIHSGTYLANKLGVPLAQASREAKASEQSLAQRAGLDTADLSLEGKSYLILQDKVDEFNTLVAITQIMTAELDALAGYLERYSESADPSAISDLEQEISGFLSTRVSRDSEILLSFDPMNELTGQGWGVTRLTEQDGLSTVDVALLEVDLFEVLFSSHPSDGCPICQSVGSQGGPIEDALWDAAPATNSSNVTGATSTSDSGVSYIETLRKGPIWDLGTGETLSYSYYTGSVPYTYGNETAGAAPMTAHESNLDLAFTAWETATPFSFEKVTESGTTVGEIRMAYTNQSYAGAGVAAFAYYPNSGVTGGDNWYVVEQASNSDFTPGTYGFITALHEIGHAIGLSHPFSETNRTQPVLSASVDNQRHTVMTYTQTDRNIYWSTSGGGLIASRTNASTPGIYDVAAIEYMYGTISDANTGDTVYSYADWNPNNPFLIRTLVDSSGTDTIDASAITRSSIIDLRPGAFSSIGVYSHAEQEVYFNATLPSTDLYTGEDNLGIAFSATIENAYGGAGNDTITGNTADNTLKGGGGNDTIDGGAGTDVAVFSGNFADYTITQTRSALTVAHNSGGDGIDTLTNVEQLNFADQTYTVPIIARPLVKDENFSPERQMERLLKAREDLEAGRLVGPKRPPSAKSKYLSRLADARQKEFGIAGLPLAAQARSDPGDLVPGHLTKILGTSQAEVQTAARITATQRNLIQSIQATLDAQASGTMNPGNPMEETIASQIAQTVRLLNAPNLVALKSISAPEVRAMLR